MVATWSLCRTHARFLVAAVIAYVLTGIPVVAAGEGRTAPGPVEVQAVSALDGKPLEGVYVRIGGRYAATSSKGTLTIDGIPAGDYSVSTRHPGYDRTNTKITLPAGRRERVDIKLAPSIMLPVEGRVATKDTGQPIPGAHFSLVPVKVPASVLGNFDFVTSWDGKFHMLELAAGTYRAQIKAAGCADVTLEFEAKSGMPPLDWRLERLSEPAPISAAVLDAVSGKPVPGARVVLSECGKAGVIAETAADNSGNAAFADVRTGLLNWADEKDRLPITRRMVTISASANGYESQVVNAQLGAKSAIPIKLNPTDKIAEQEPNDTLQTAQTIRSGAPVEFAIAKNGDSDYFRFHIDYPSQVRVELAAGTPIETMLSLLDRDGKVLREQGMAPGTANVISAGGLQPGDYHVAVSEWGNNGSSVKPMTLSVTLDPGADAFEPNNSAKSARSLRPGEEVRGTILPVGDTDWFRFEVKRPCHARVTIQPHSIEMFAALRDAAGTSRAEQGVAPGAMLDISAQLEPGIYTVDVHEWGDNGESLVPYRLRLDVIEDDLVDDPPSSPTRVGAVRELPLGGLCGTTIFPSGDTDTYAVSIPSSGRVHVESFGPIELQSFLLDLKGHELAQAGVAPRARGHIAADIAGPATVFVRLAEWGNNGCATDPCTISCWFEPCDETEATGRNETYDLATPAELNEPVRGSIEPVGDIDWYQIDIDHPGWLTVDGSGPTELWGAIRDSKRNVLTQRGIAPGASLALECPVLPGSHFFDIHEWGDNGSSPLPYSVHATLRRAEPMERVPLRNDPIRRLNTGEAQAFWIDQVGDRDRFVYDVAQAGKYTLRMRAPIEIFTQVFDDRTGEKLFEQGNAPNTDVAREFESKGPMRFRVELSEWGDNGLSLSPGFVMFGGQTQSLPGVWITATPDPFDPSHVTFERKELAGFKGNGAISIDVDGDGRGDLPMPGSQAGGRYPTEGLYKASALLEGDSGTKAIIPFWVEATGARERKGVYAMIDHPSPDAIVEDDTPIRARALSYSGERIARVDFYIDGKPLAKVHSAPFTVDTDWTKIGPGEHELSVTAVDAAGQSATTKRKFRVSDYFGLTPEDNAVVSGNSVRVTWTGPDFGPTTVRVREKGGTTWTEEVGESGSRRSVLLAGLEAGKAYEFQPVGGAEPGPVRSVTRVKGLAFGRSSYGADIRRDYDQRLGISVRNHGEKPLTVRLECGKPDDPTMLAGFVGEGSEGAPVDLGPGQERDFMLGVSAQDVTMPLQRFPIRITGDSGLSDEAMVELNVKLPQVKFEWETLGATEHGYGQRYRLHNRGDAVTDLSITADSKDVSLSPSIHHGLFPAGSSMDISAWPRLYSGFQKVEATLTASAVGKQTTQPFQSTLKPDEKVFLTWLLPHNDGQTSDTEKEIIEQARIASTLDAANVDWSKRENPVDVDGDGRADRWTLRDTTGTLWIGDDTDADGQVDFAHADVGENGVFDYSAFKTPRGWEQTNVVEAWLEMGFALPYNRSAYEKHDADIIMNGTVIGRLRDTIPEGNYTFRIPPQVLLFSSEGRPEGNTVAVKTRHLRGGHYVVNSDYRLRFRLTATPLWSAGKTEAEARERAEKTEGVALDAPDFSVSSAELRVDAPAEIVRRTDIAVEVPMRNLGSSARGPVAVALMRMVPNQKPVELSRVLVENPGLGAPPVVRLPWKATAGDHDLRVVVDPDSLSGDVSRSNNEAAVAVKVKGDDSPPTVRLLEPADKTVLTGTVTRLRLETSGDAGSARCELSVDGGLWQPLPRDAMLSGTSCLLQPGAHTLNLRMADDAGRKAETSGHVLVEATKPDARMVAPEAGTRVETSAVAVRMTVPADAILVAARVGDGGPWRKMTVSGNEAFQVLPVRFGSQSLEGLVVGKDGAAALTTSSIECTRQTLSGDLPPPAQDAQSGVTTIEGIGPIDFFASLNGVGATLTEKQAADSDGLPTWTVGSDTDTTYTPKALQAGTKGVYRGLSDDVYMMADFTDKKVSLQLTDTSGTVLLQLAGPLKAAGPYGPWVGTSPANGGSTREEDQVRYSFDPRGRMAQTSWGSEDLTSKWPSMWVRVQEVGSTKPWSGAEENGKEKVK